VLDNIQTDKQLNAADSLSVLKQSIWDKFSLNFTISPSICPVTP